MALKNRIVASLLLAAAVPVSGSTALAQTGVQQTTNRGTWETVQSPAVQDSSQLIRPADPVSTSNQTFNAGTSNYYNSYPNPQEQVESGAPVQGSVGDQEVPFSRPTPPQIESDTPPAGNVQNFFEGHEHVQDLSGLLPGRFENTKYKWYGFARLDAIYDFNPIGTTDMFVTSSIPIPQGEGQNFVLTPRYTRLGFDTETPWEACNWTIKTRIEMDFFNGNRSGAFGSFPIRLRFAWVDFGPFLIGQAASLFMDYDVFPNVLDYEGPPGMVLMRQPIAAIRVPLGCRTKIAMGIEQPYSDIQWFDGANWVLNPGSGIVTTAGADRNIQDVPDLTGNWRYTGDFGHLQVAGIARKISFLSGAGLADDEFGYGANLTGTWHPWAHFMGCPSGEGASPLQKSRFLWQYASGEGINRYIQDVNGLGLDAAFDPATGLDLIRASGWFMSYEHWWSQKWASVLSYGVSETELDDTTLPANTYARADYITANLIWLPVERMGVGLEYMFGSRENRDGQTGEANRIQMAFQYKF